MGRGVGCLALTAVLVLILRGGTFFIKISKTQKRKSLWRPGSGSGQRPACYCCWSSVGCQTVTLSSHAHACGRGLGSRIYTSTRESTTKTRGNNKLHSARCSVVSLSLPLSFFLSLPLPLSSLSLCSEWIPLMISPMMRPY